MKRQKNTKLFYSIEGIDFNEILEEHSRVKKSHDNKLRERGAKVGRIPHHLPLDPAKRQEVLEYNDTIPEPDFDDPFPKQIRYEIPSAVPAKIKKATSDNTLIKKYKYFIHNLIARQISSNDGKAQLNSKVLEKVFDKEYTLIVRTLKNLNIIECDDYYDIGTKSYGYNISANRNITASYESIYYPSKQYIKTLEKELQKQTKNNTAQAKENLTDCFYNNYIQSLSKLKLQFEDKANKFIDIHFTNNTNSKLYYQYIIEQYQNHNFDIKVPNTKDNRIYHILTSTPRLLKYFLNIKYTVDIHNSHPLLFVNEIYEYYKVPTSNRYLISLYIREIYSTIDNNRYNIRVKLYNKLKESNINYPEIKEIPLDAIRYIYLVSAGKFWDKVLPDLNEPQEGNKYNIIRQDVKVIMFAQVFYGKQLTSRGQEYAKIFKEQFPSVYSIILSFKRGLDKSERTVLTHKLMALESKLFREVLRRLYELNYAVISIHDAIVVLDVKENDDCTPMVVKEIITNVYKEYGLLPDCSVDYYGESEMEAFLEKEKFLREKGDELISELRVLAEEDEEIQQLISDYDNGKSEIVLTPDKQNVMLHLRDTKDLMYRK